MRFGLLLFGLLNGVLATLVAIRLGAGLGEAAVFYTIASTLSVLAGALFWANRPQILRARGRPGVPFRPHRARHPGPAHARADARDWSAAA